MQVLERSRIQLRPYGPRRLGTSSKDWLRASNDDESRGVMGHGRRTPTSQEKPEWRGIQRAGRRVRVHPNAFGGMNGTTFRKVDGVDMRLPSLGPRTEDQSSWRCGAEMGRWERRAGGTLGAGEEIRYGRLELGVKCEDPGVY